MECVPIELEMPDGYKRNVDVCRDAKLPRNIKGTTNKKDKILISRYLDDLHELGISDPERYVLIHECFHILHPEKSEYEIRRLADKEYEWQTGEKIDTTTYFNFLEHIRKTESATRDYIV
jgi:hypothetical protein